MIELSPTEKELVLSVFSKGASIGESHYFDNYNLPCPIKVEVNMPNGESKFVVLRQARHGDVDFSMRTEYHLKKAKSLLLDALNTLENISNKIESDTTQDLLPRYSLIDEFDAVANQVPWNTEILFAESVNTLRPVLKKISTPLVFTNGDYHALISPHPTGWARSRREAAFSCTNNGTIP